MVGFQTGWGLEHNMLQLRQPLSSDRRQRPLCLYVTSTIKIPRIYRWVEKLYMYKSFEAKAFSPQEKEVSCTGERQQRCTGVLAR